MYMKNQARSVMTAAQYNAMARSKRNHYEDQDVCGWIILKWSSER
jgi:hypothetical protein